MMSTLPNNLILNYCLCVLNKVLKYEDFIDETMTFGRNEKIDNKTEVVLYLLGKLYIWTKLLLLVFGVVTMKNPLNIGPVSILELRQCPSINIHNTYI